MAADILVPFGFTALESEIYAFLCQESPATGYRIAQGINKPAANTYKGIQSLQAKGAILVEEGASRLCRALPPKELMARLQRDFEANRKAAEKALTTRRAPVDDERVYRLTSAEQITGKLLQMARGAKRSFLVRCSGETAVELQNDLTAALARGVAVALVSPEPIANNDFDSSTLSGAKPDSLVAVADANEFMLGTSSDAYWSRSAILGSSIEESLAAQLALGQVAHLLALDEKRSRIQRIVDGWNRFHNRQE